MFQENTLPLYSQKMLQAAIFGNNMVIQRNFYLQKLVDGLSNKMIKIITGIRRTGKSYLLFELFHRYLVENLTDESHVIEIALDNRLNKELRDPDKMLAFISGSLKDAEMHYILLDEVQMMDEFVDVLNSVLHFKNVQVYVTGSNSRFLSKDIATEFRGRGYEIHIFPLSFAEYYSGIGGDKQDCWKEYCAHGGLPQLLDYSNNESKEEFLISLISSVYIKDILERHTIRNQEELDELLCVVASMVGSKFNAKKISDTFKSTKHKVIDRKTIAKYLEYVSDAFIVERSRLYNIRGKSYINTLSKYYFQDVGLRNALLNFRQNDTGHLMENIIYNELRMRGYRVDVGQVTIQTRNKENNIIRKNLEVDFVVNQGDMRLYIQSADKLPDIDKVKQESASLMKINDFFRRVIIVNDNIKSYWNDDGIYIMNLYDFLLDLNSLTKLL